MNLSAKSRVTEAAEKAKQNAKNEAAKQEKKKAAMPRLAKFIEKVDTDGVGLFSTLTVQDLRDLLKCLFDVRKDWVLPTKPP